MDRRCAAGALLALAACIATTAAAPTASNQTALDLYDGASEGCYYNFQHYGEGDRIMTNEPCLNCTCHNRMLMCYLRVCPFTKPIGQDCSVEKRADQCCPIVTCPDVPVDLLTSTSTSSPSEYGETGVGKLDRYGCSINGKYFPEGSKVPPSPNKPCEHCYCIRNMTTCVMQECTLHVDGCTPIYRKDVCCPVRYSCDHPEDEMPLLDDMTTTVRPTPGFLLTTTTLSPVTQMTQDCVHDDKIFADGALIKTEKACEHCYCMKGDIVCVVQECGTPMENEGKNCTSMPPREGQCCPDTYICEGDELTTEAKPDFTAITSFEDITTLSPPRRVSIEGSGYRSETDEPSTEAPTFEPEIEGSGEDQSSFKPTDINDMLIPESETSPPLFVTSQDKYSPSTTEEPDLDNEMAQKATTEADKGENTVPSGDEDTSEGYVHDKTTPELETTTSDREAATEASVATKTTSLPEDKTSGKDETTIHDEIMTTERAPIPVSTISDHNLNTFPGSRTTSEEDRVQTTLPTRRKEDDDIVSVDITTEKYLEETTKVSEFIAPDTVITESTPSSEEHKTETPKIPENYNEVTVPTTDIKLEITTKPDAFNIDDQSATTIPTEIATDISTPGKSDIADTTSANPIENEIDEEAFPTLAPGRIPGEGDCLLDGVTYSHESIVPTSSNCHTSCKCISSIVKCEPIICSPPPDYMDNCQPMYDSPESCCPTYVCGQPKETVPPQSHSQMAGTESPVPTPTLECDGDQCEIVKDKEDANRTVSCTSEGCTDDSNKKHVDSMDCGPQGCGEVQTKPEKLYPLEPTDECVGDSCSSPPVHCASGNCEISIPKDQTCNNENGCEIPVIQTCSGDNCANQPDITAARNDSTPCDNPEKCTDVKGPENASDCKDESCISKSPPQIEPQDKQDCKDDENCAQQTPVVEECNEEECKRQQVPEISKPHSSDCSDTECTQQQDNVPQITTIPEIETESTPKVTVLPEEPEIKPEELVTDTPKTTDIKTETESSVTTKASISDKNEELGTTSRYEESNIKKEKEPEPNVTEIPEIVTQESVTENALGIETTVVPLTDITKAKEIISEVTTAISEASTTEIPSLPEQDIKEITTELPIFVDTKPPESSTDIDNTHTGMPVTVNATTDKNVFDIATTGPVYSTSSDVNQETTESQEMLTTAPESLDKDGHEETTKEPEYVQDTEPKVTEPTERYTSEADQVTNKLEEGHTPEGAPTTPKSDDSQTRVPGTFETEEPINVPETQTTAPQDQDKKETDIPVSISEEPITEKPDDAMDSAGDTSTSENKAETKSPMQIDEATSKPEIALGESVTQTPELDVTPKEESITEVPDDESTIITESPKPLVTLPEETATAVSDVKEKDTETPAPVTVDVQTDSPMTIVKTHGDDTISSTIAPESETTVRDELIKTETTSPYFEQSTEPISKLTEMPSKKPASEFEKLPSESDVDLAATTTETSKTNQETTISAITENVITSEQPARDSDKTTISEPEASSDSTPVSVPVIIETTSTEPSVGEASTESSAPPEGSSESAPITLTPSLGIKSPVPVTESPMQPISEGVEVITPAQEQSNEDTDVTELPELVIHEHPTEPSSIEKESEQPATQDITTYLPDMGVKEQEVLPVKDTSDTPLHDDSTMSTAIPEISAGETVTKIPESSQSDTTESKPDLPSISIISPTESQMEVTEGPESQAITTVAPGIAITDGQKEATERLPIQTTVSTAPETEGHERVTEGVDAQYTVTDTDELVTEHHKFTTESPLSYDMITNTPDMDAKPHKESTDKPKESATVPHKEITGTHVSTTAVPDVSPTELHKDSTEIPDIHDIATKVPDVSPTESDKDGVYEPESQNVVTSVPKISTTGPEPETTTMSEAQNVPTNIPETEPKKDVTESSVAQDLTTSTPTIPVTEHVSLEDTVSPILQDKTTTAPEIQETESHKEGTESPAHVITSTNVPDEHATESQKEVTDGPAIQNTITNVPEQFTTESPEEIQSPEHEYTTTSAPKLPETEPKKETTETPVQDVSSTSPDISEAEPKKEITEMPETPLNTDVPEVPATTATVSPVGVQQEQDAVTNAPEVQKDVTDIQEAPEDTVSGPNNVQSEAPTETTESQKEATDIPDILMTTASNAPEMLATKSDKDVTEQPDNITEEDAMPPKHEQIEAETEKSAVTEKDEAFTETPSSLTTKFEDQSQSQPQEIDTPTESSKIKLETTLSTESGIPVEPFTKVTDSMVTDSPEKTTGSDSDIDKPSSMTSDEKTPHEGQETDTEAPLIEPTKTESPTSSDSIEPETKAPAFIDSETGTSTPPESPVTEKQDHTYVSESEPQGSRRTEATNAPVEEDDVVTKAPQTIEPQDKTTKISEEPEQTSDSKEEYPETTPYLVLLEEHTHKTVSPEEDISGHPSDVPLKELEPSTPEAATDKVTEPAPITEVETSPEDMIPEKEQSVPELTQTTISAEKITETSLVPEEVTTVPSSHESLGTEKPHYVESNEISTSAPITYQDENETEKPLVPSIEAETEKEVVVTSQKPPETTIPEEEFIYATTKATTIKKEHTTVLPLLDKFGKPDEEPPAESEKPQPDTAEVPKPGTNEVQPTEEAIQPEEESHFPPSGTGGYGQEPDYGEEDSFGPGTCRYGGKVYVSAQQIPRDDPCDFCFCFRSDIICLQQSCPPPIHGCHEEPIQGFCCPRYECPVSMATTLNVTTTTTTTTTTLPPHFLPHAYKGAAQRRGCQIKGHTYKVGEVVRASSGPCLHCTCGGDGQMKCDPKVCTPEPMLRQMIAAAVSAKRRR